MKCEIPSNHRKQFGIGEKFLQSVSILLSKPSLKQVRNLARNLGVDDLRTVETRKEKAYIFGKNLADIDHWGGGSVKPDTIVKKQNADGELEYFISKGSTDSEPSKWTITEQGKVIPNPHWDYVGKNATLRADGSLQRFTQVKTNIYKPDDGGETLLKVVKPYTGDKVPTKKELTEQGYDAVKLSDGSYRVFDENKQAVDPKTATVSVKDNALESETVPTKPKDLDEQTVQEQVETLGLGRKTLYGIGGYAAGELTENWTDSDTNLGWAGGALGVLLATPKARTKISGVFTGSKANNYTEEVRRLTERNKEISEAQEMVRHGFKGDFRDKESLQQYKEKVYNSWTALKERGQEVWSSLFRNDYLSSGLSFFRRLGIKSAEDLERTFRGVETYHITLFRNYSDKIEERFGRATTLEDFKGYQRDVIRDYIRSRKIQGFEDVSDKWLEDEMGASIFRIRTYGGELDDNGRLVWDEDNLTANKIYSDEDVVDIDRFILESEQGRNVVGVFEDHFEDMGELALKTYKDNFVKELDEMSPEFARVAKSIRDSGLSIKQWKENLGETISKASVRKEIIKSFEKAQKNTAFQHAIEYHELALKVENLKGRYIPQMRSERKVENLKKQFMNRPEVRQLSDKGKQDAWDKHLSDRILEVNRDNYKAFRVAASGDDIEPILKRRQQDILDEYANHLVYRIQDEEVRQKVIRDLASDNPSIIENYIGKTVRGKEGKEYYYIKDANVPKEDGTSVRILDDINREEIDKAQKTFLKMTTLLQSDHLDKPRMYNLPTDMIETNMENVVRRYSIDAGNRLYMHMNGLGTETRLNRKISQITKELEEKGVTKDEVADQIASIKSWYANITRTSDAIEINMDSNDILARYNRRKKNNKIVNTLMNFGYMPFLWFTSFYSLFQPFITGPFIASYGNIWKTYKQFFKNPEEFKNLTNELHKMGVIQQKVKSFSAEMEHHYSKDALSGTDASFLDWIYDLSQRGVEFSANFSLVKKVLSHPSVKIDLEDTGLLRFVGGSMLDISGAESALTTMAVFREVENLVEAGDKLLKQQGAQQVKVGGKNYRIGDVRRKLRELGVDNPDKFIEDSIRINKTLADGETSNIGTFLKRITRTDEEGSGIPPELVKEYTRIADTTVNQLHGRTRLSRPVKWTNNPYGRLLSQFSVYSQNFAVQTVMQRIYTPIKSWVDTYQPDSTYSMMKIMWHMKQGNDIALKKILGDNWEQAYNDFPIDAFNNLFRVMPVVMGTGAVMGATRDTVMDFVNLLGATATGEDDFEAWKNTRENAETMKQYVSGDKNGYDIIKMARDVAHLGVDMGFTGRAGQILINESRYTNGGLWSKTPITGMINDFYEAGTTPFRVAPEDILPSTSKAVAEELLLRTPIIGSFNGFRSSLINSVFNKPKNRDVQFYNAENGSPINSISLNDF